MCNPNMPIMIEPNSCIYSWCASMNSMMNPILQPTNRAYTRSDVVAPSPVAMPCQRPRVTVRCMHNTPNGPTGTDTHKPINIPVNIVVSIA